MRRLFAIAFIISGVFQLNAKEPKALDLEKGRTLFKEDFEKGRFDKDWEKRLGENIIEDGRLSSTEGKKDNHEAVNAISVDAEDIIVDFEFEMDDAASVGVSFADMAMAKEVHAGHIARVMIYGNTVTLRDDKTGVMNLKIREKKKHPKFEKTFKDYLEKRILQKNAKVKKGKKHQLNVQVLDDIMTVRLDGKVVGSLQSPGIAHKPKKLVRLYSGKGTSYFDNIVISKPKR